MKYATRFIRLGQASVLEDVLEAGDERTLRHQLERDGYTVLSVKAMPERRWSLASLKPKTNPYPLLCREIKTLIQAGMTVVEAVDTLAAREKIQGRSTSLPAVLLHHIQQGQSLSAALAQLPQTPAVLVAAVRAGERTSNLAEALDDYLRFDLVVNQLRKKIISAAIYPAIVSLMGFGIALFLLLVVMPNFAAMYSDLRGNSAGATSVAIALSHFIGSHRAGVLVVLGLLIAALAYWVLSGQARQQLSSWAYAVPWIRDKVQDFQLAMMYQALALLIRGGYPLVEALQIASRSALSARLREALDQARGKIERGESVSQALASHGLCDEIGRRLMAAAERNGNFHLAADVVSKLHGERFELFVERLTRIVEPVLLLIVALVVGGIVIMMYLPVFDMATQLL